MGQRRSSGENKEALRAALLGLAALAVVAGAVGVTAPPVTAQGPRPFPPPAIQERLIEKFAATGSALVIVGMREPFVPAGALSGPQAEAEQQDRLRAASDRIQSQLPAGSIASVKKFSTIPFFAAEVSLAGFTTLANLPEVASIQEDRLWRPSDVDSTPLVGANTAWAAGYTGTNAVVAILDTGVDKNHVFLSPRVTSEACYSTTYAPAHSTSLCPGGVSQTTAVNSGLHCSTTIGGCFHGTHVAGIAAGSYGSYSGIATSAGLIAIQVFSRIDSVSDCSPNTSPCALSFTSDQIAGLERIYALRSTANIAAVNMSIGGGQYFSQSTCDADYTAEKAAIDTLRSVGIATVVSSGNDGYRSSMSAPGCISSAVSVASTTKADAMSSFSNTASFLNLLAPGSSIVSSYPGGLVATANGTSMAAPHVSGAWAILKGAKPTAGVAEVLSALQATGVSITDPVSGLVFPRIRVDRALTRLVPSTSGCAVITIPQATLPNMAVGVAYGTTITASGGTAPYRFSLTAGALPAGMTLTSAGLLSGTPTTAGTSTFTIRGTDANACFAERAYTMVIPAPPGCAVITILQTTLPNMAVGVGYGLTLTATGGTAPYRFSLTAGALPAGMTLTAAGVLAGTPTSAGIFTFTIRGTDANGCFGAVSYTMLIPTVLTLQPPGPPLNFSASPVGTSAYLGWVAPDTGGAPTSYTIEAGSATGAANLATLSTAGLTYAASNVGAGTYYLRVRAVNAAGTSPPSNEAVLVMGPPASPGCPTAPRSLVNASQSNGTISLTWSGPAAGTATSYVIVAGSAPGLSDLANFDTGSTALSYVATGVPAGSYYVRVHAKGSCGVSGASNEVLVFVVGFTGEVQVSVSWDAPADVDLHVIEPSGAEIYWGNSISATGGQLDVDSNPACNIDGRQIENIRWSSRAPAGTYTVRVNYWSSCGVALTNYLVTVKNGGSTQTFVGTFTGAGGGGGSGSGRTITTFTHAASLVLDSVLRLAWPLPPFTPNLEKLKLRTGPR